jgi:hypothetical protein
MLLLLPQISNLPGGGVGGRMGGGREGGQQASSSTRQLEMTPYRQKNIYILPINFQEAANGKTIPQ